MRLVKKLMVSMCCSMIIEKTKPLLEKQYTVKILINNLSSKKMYQRLMVNAIVLKIRKNAIKENIIR